MRKDFKYYRLTENNNFQFTEIRRSFIIIIIIF